MGRKRVGGIVLDSVPNGVFVNAFFSKSRLFLPYAQPTTPCSTKKSGSVLRGGVLRTSVR